MSKRPHTAEFVEATAFICIVVAMAMTWYYGYVKPGDEHRYKVMSCMEDIGDHSETGYKACFERILGERPDEGR